MAELDYITIKGFKSLKTVEELKLGSCNVVIGANGSGKSNFIEAFSFLHQIREGRLQEYAELAGGADNILFLGSKETGELFFKLSFQDGLNGYEIRLKPTDEEKLSVVDEEVQFWDKTYPTPYRKGLPRANGEAGISKKGLRGTANWVRDRLGRWRIYHFHDTSRTSPMKKSSEIADNRFLRPDASNLAAFLYLLQEEHESEYELIRQTVQRVAPFFDDFILEPLRLNQNQVRLEWRHKRTDKYFGPAAFSDGTLRFISLCTLLQQPKEYRSSIILIDEPELGLHPYAITMLASLIRAASVDSQIIISTQSPVLLDHFEPEEILVANRIESSTTLERLDTAKLEAWLDEYSLGQLWEKNEFGGRPGSE